MSKITRLVIYYFFVCLILVGCRSKDLDLNPSYSGDKLVLWGNLQAGKSIRIQVTKTFNPTGKIPIDLSVTNAIVVIKKGERDEFKLTPSLLQKGIYVSDSLIEAGESYVISVSSPTLPTAESNIILIPTDVQILNYIQKKNVPGVKNPNVPQDLISLYFTRDQINANKYYSINFLAYYKDETVSSIWPSADNVVANETDCYTWAPDITGYYQGLFLMANQCLPEQGIPLNFSTETSRGTFSSDSFYYEKPLKVEMNIGSISKEWFDYAKVEYEQPEGLDNLVFPPKITFSNIKNGYGLIFASNEKTIQLK
jgi:hypothetical protein